MKKIFTSILMLLFATNYAFAQTVQFVDKSGNSHPLVKWRTGKKIYTEKIGRSL